MSGTRNLRANKGRLCIGFGLFLTLFGFVAIFHTSQKQLDTCVQQKDSINLRMRALKEHKYKLEQNLESERREHLETKTSLEQQMKEQKDAHGKNSMDATNRFDTLHKNYKILQDQHDKLEEECTKRKNTQGDEINGLERKAKLLTSQMTQIKSQNAKDLELWRVKYEKLSKENNRLENLLSTKDTQGRIHQLEIELADYRKQCKLNKPRESKHLELDDHPLNKPDILKTFSEQKLVSENVYEIPIKRVVGESNISAIDTTNNKRMAPLNSLIKSAGVINSVENFQIAPQEIQVIQAPPALKPSTTSSSSAPINQVSSVAVLAKRSSASGTTKTTIKKKVIPPELGVAPVPENFPEDPDLIEPDNNLNNRYLNIAGNGGNDVVAAAAAANDEDNGALSHKDLQEVLDDANPGADDMNDDEKRPKDRHGELEDDDLEGPISHLGHNRKKSKGSEHLLDDNLNNEVAGDQGKEQDELGIADDGPHEEDEDEDGDDYGNHEARLKEGQAIRN